MTEATQPQATQPQATQPQATQPQAGGITVEQFNAQQQQINLLSQGQADILAAIKEMRPVADGGTEAGQQAAPAADGGTEAGQQAAPAADSGTEAANELMREVAELKKQVDQEKQARQAAVRQAADQARRGLVREAAQSHEVDDAMLDVFVETYQRQFKAVEGGLQIVDAEGQPKLSTEASSAGQPISAREFFNEVRQARPGFFKPKPAPAPGQQDRFLATWPMRDTADVADAPLEKAPETAEDMAGIIADPAKLKALQEGRLAGLV